MNPRWRNLLEILGPIVLILLGLATIGISFAMEYEASRTPAVIQHSAGSMARTGVILVLGGLACGFVTYLSGASQRTSEGGSDAQ